MLFNQALMAEPASPINIARPPQKGADAPLWPTPPYEENEWAAAASASIYAIGSLYR
jgi:meiosis induction protein kinase IME2/SME1